MKRDLDNQPVNEEKNTISSQLNGPISRDSAIVSLRCPLSRDTFSAIPAIPQQGCIPALGALFYTDISVRYPILQHIARYSCDTPGKEARTSFAILSLNVSRDTRSIAAGPLSFSDFVKLITHKLGCSVNRPVVTRVPNPHLGNR